MSQSRLHVTTDKSKATDIADVLDPVFEEEGITTVLFETEQDNGKWCYSIYVDQGDVDQQKARMQKIMDDLITGLKIEEETLGDVDWVSATLKELAPVTAGRFFVHGSHDRNAAKKARIAVEVDAGQAFGTGHHGTTAGCLDMLEVVLRQSSGQLGKPRRAMDIGTGSGVLAIALAKVANIPVLATDIDPISTVTARNNCTINGVQNFVRCETSTGFQHPIFNEFGKADLIFANILARPLEALASTMHNHVTSGAHVILSGLLPHQRARITAAYQRQNFTLQQWKERDGWLTILIRAA